MVSDKPEQPFPPGKKINAHGLPLMLRVCNAPLLFDGVLIHTECIQTHNFRTSILVICEILLVVRSFRKYFFFWIWFVNALVGLNNSVHSVSISNILLHKWFQTQNRDTLILSEGSCRSSISSCIHFKIDIFFSNWMARWWGEWVMICLPWILLLLQICFYFGDFVCSEMIRKHCCLVGLISGRNVSTNAVGRTKDWRSFHSWSASKSICQRNSLL